jgi:hypothetical protein
MAIGVGLAHESAGSKPFHPHPTFDLYVPEVDIPTDDPRYPGLRLIDPYDETVLSAYQCDVLEPDFARWAADSRDPEAGKVLDLVRRCAGDVSTSLWFLGD